MDERLPTILAILITIIWTASIVLEAAWERYEPPATVHGLMMAAAGWAFGERYVRRGRKNGDHVD